MPMVKSYVHLFNEADPRLKWPQRSGQVKASQVNSSRRGSSGVDYDIEDGGIVALQNDAYQLCDEIRCDTICDFRTALRKYEHFYRGLLAYCKRRVYSCESSVQSGVDKGKNSPEPSPDIATHCCRHMYLILQGRTATYTPQWHG